MRYVRCLDKLDMTDNIIKICVNLSNLCHLCAIKHNAKLSFTNKKSRVMATTTTKKTVWSIVLKAIVAVATALAGVFGISSCVGR